MRVIFLDRDGVINKYPGDTEYVKSWNEFHFLPKVKLALKKLTDCGYKIFIVSNQAGISKGIYTKESLDLITRNMLKELEDYNVDIQGVYYCIHQESDNCPCRKPKTGLIDMAMRELKHEFKVHPTNGYFIGDTIRDIQTGKAAGLVTILVFSGKERPDNKDKWQILPDFTADNLSEAVDIILKTK